MRCNTIGLAGTAMTPTPAVSYNQSAAAAYAAQHMPMPSSITAMNTTLSTTAPLTASTSFVPVASTTTMPPCMPQFQIGSNTTPTAPVVSYTPPIGSAIRQASYTPGSSSMRFQSSQSPVPAPATVPTISYTPPPVLSPQPSRSVLL